MSGEKIFNEIKAAIKAHTRDRLTFHDVEQVEFDHVMQGLRLPKNYLEEYAFRIHWFPKEKYLKVIMASELHESPAAWVFNEIQYALGTGIIPPAWVDKIVITASPIYKNFRGAYAGYAKEADLTIVPLLGPDWTQEREFPSVVLESGWTEPAAKLELDARVWQQGSEGAVRVVIQVKFFKRAAGRIGSRVRITRATPMRRSFKITNKEYDVLPPPAKPIPGPSITLDEFFAGGCPPGINPQGFVTLNLDKLWVIVRAEIISQGSVPDEGSEGSVVDEDGESSVLDEGGHIGSPD